MTEDVDFPPKRSRPVEAWSGILDRGGRLPAAPLRAEVRVLFCFDGLMRVATPAGHWFIPDRCGIWLPPGTAPELDFSGRMEVQCFAIAPRFAARTGLPPRPAVLRATPLIRGAGRRLMPPTGQESPLGPAEARRLCWVLLDEIARLERPELHLPGAGDPRLARVMARLMAHPAEAGNLARLAQGVGSSERTLGRLFAQETGLGWRDWRDRLRLVLAVEGLQAGRSSTELAHWLGYSTPSAFVAAFRRQSGMTPGEWRRRA
ncbi:AraC family transcriptional regulator [Poseidonocella sp. HB161398]|uniref:helix-turn-helix domain-containing protein n=1 Tax=Poseidonocella sp. HB161398 TaxID=2320855 RepID=UPI001108D68F|nr:AraC family transcriptional regulator [Poseidonocella sp. HB161398]